MITIFTLIPIKNSDVDENYIIMFLIKYIIMLDKKIQIQEKW